MTKRCPTCRKTKPLSAFGKNRKEPSGYAAYCRSCLNEKSRKWRETNREKFRASARASDRRKKLKAYGLTEDEYLVLLDKQKGRCAICEKPESEKRGTLSVDHDHKTGRIRGLLCGPCNRGLGMLGDDPQRLSRAIHYLT